MVCQELVELITDYLEDSLSPAERARFDAHLATCQHCRAYLAQMRFTLTLLGALTEDSIPPEGRDALLETFRGWRTER
jgi:anti-sigma factor RsiW